MTDKVDDKVVPFCGYSTADGYSEEECHQLNQDCGQSIARIILEQFGGTGFVRMTGAYHLSSHSDEGKGALSFRFKGSSRANHLKVILTAMDTYTLRFTKIKGFDFGTVEVVEDIYCDQLTDVFSRVTGLATELPRVRFV